MADCGRRTVLTTVGTLFGAGLVGISVQAGQSGGQRRRRDAREKALDGIIGSWVQNVEKSNYDPGPPLKSQVRQFDYTFDGNLLCHMVQERQDGTKFVGHWIASMDGRHWPEYFRSQGSIPALVISPQKIDDRHSGGLVYRNGQAVSRASWEISEDGNTLTQVLVSLDQDGNITRSNTVVYEKVLDANNQPVSRG